jgi:hypothetical protein
MKIDQSPERKRRTSERRDGSSAQQNRQRERANPVGADTDVAHDFEFAFARRAAAKPIGGIGQAIFMQAAGHGERGSDAQCRRWPRAQSKPVRQCVNHAANQADNDSRNWKRPACAGDVGFRGSGSISDRQTRQKGNACPDTAHAIRNQVFRHWHRRLHRVRCGCARSYLLELQLRSVRPRNQTGYGGF